MKNSLDKILTLGAVDVVTINKGIPRFVEASIAAISLVGLAPFILAAALGVALTSRGPVIFRQRRIGLKGHSFVLYKLRTMHDSGGGPQLTSTNDQRVTRVGKILRKTKLDELPELWNVIKGDMSLVGPRPEVPRYVDPANPQWAVVLLTRPGLTDPVTMRLRNEEELLQQVKGDREHFYLDVLQPLKLRGYVDYLQMRSWSSDVKILWHSALAVLVPGKVRPLTVKDVITEGLG
jgi:lipopolysaccharide/colanic/teichoic acid biosynthesis glycosyltransferase